MELCVRTRNKSPTCIISTINTRPANQRRRRLLIGKTDSESTPIYSDSTHSPQLSSDLSSNSATQPITTSELPNCGSTTNALNDITLSEPQQAKLQQNSTETPTNVDNHQSCELQSPIESVPEHSCGDEDGDDDDVAAVSCSCNGSTSRSSHESYSSINSQRVQYQQHKWQGNTLAQVQVRAWLVGSIDVSSSPFGSKPICSSEDLRPLFSVYLSEHTNYHYHYQLSDANVVPNAYTLHKQT